MQSAVGNSTICNVFLNKTTTVKRAIFILSTSLHTEALGYTENGKRKYKFFDSKLMESFRSSENNHNGKAALTLPPIQLNLEHIEDENKNKNQRRILTAYQCYFMEQKQELKKNSRSMSDIKILKRVAMGWKKLDYEEKQKYVDQAQNIVNDLLKHAKVK